MASTPNEDTNICPSKEPINKNITINILTRSGNRPIFFKVLKNSILTQTYPYIRHIISNDNPNCTYLNDEKYVYAVTKQPSIGYGFYNLYLNELAKQIEDGWVIILDDDSKLIDNTFVEKLAEMCSKSNKDDVLIYQNIIWPNKTLIPSSTHFKDKSISFGNIDMVCFCVHYTIFNKIQFEGLRGGDFSFLNNIQQSKQYKFKFVILPVGIWANYSGAKHGN